MRAFTLHVRERPLDDEMFVHGEGAVLTAKEGEGEVEVVLNALARFQPLALKENVGLEITLDKHGRVVSVRPEELREKVITL